MDKLERILREKDNKYLVDVVTEIFTVYVVKHDDERVCCNLPLIIKVVVAGMVISMYTNPLSPFKRYLTWKFWISPPLNPGFHEMVIVLCVALTNWMSYGGSGLPETSPNTGSQT